MCSPGYIMDGEGKCQKCSNGTDKGCWICNPKNDNECIMCMSGYYQNKEGECVKISGNDNVDTSEPVETQESYRIFGVFYAILLI